MFLEGVFDIVEESGKNQQNLPKNWGLVVF